MKTVGIIGAGASGLCSIKHSLANGLQPVAWEHGSSMGGTWNYTESFGMDDLGYPIYSSMYKNLRTNLPKEIMRFPDFPFPDEDESFVHHSSILRYLELYAEQFNLLPYINFNHHVNLVQPIFDGEKSPTWKVTIKDLKTGEISYQKCDFMLICNGHYSKPIVPPLTDIEKFKGFKQHSHNYRHPEDYIGKTVAILGAGFSGVDIALDLCEVAVKVYLCHNHQIPIHCKFSKNLSQRKGIVKAQENGFILKDGSFIEADALLCCTGYEYDFPFLSPECRVWVENNTVRPLYKDVLHTDYPTMGFPGLLNEIIPFLFFDIQIRFLFSIFIEKMTPPTSAQMNLETDRALLRFKYEGNDPKKYVQILTRQDNYLKQLLDMIHQEHFPSFYQKMLKIVLFRSLFGFHALKNYRYTITAEGAVRETLGGVEIATKWKLLTEVVRGIVSLSFTNFSDVCHFMLMYLWKRFKTVIFDILSRMGAWDNYL